MPNASLIGVLRGVGKFTPKHSSVVYRAYWRNKCALRFTPLCTHEGLIRKNAGFHGQEQVKFRTDMTENGLISR